MVEYFTSQDALNVTLHGIVKLQPKRNVADATAVSFGIVDVRKGVRKRKKQRPERS